MAHAAVDSNNGGARYGNSKMRPEQLDRHSEPYLIFPDVADGATISIDWPLAREESTSERFTAGIEAARTRAADTLLALMVMQARRDEMDHVTFGFDVAAASCTLTYARTRDADTAGSWEMVPPPPDVYPWLFQSVIRHSLMEAEYPPLRGKLRVQDGTSRFELAVSIVDLNRVAIAVR